MSNGTPDSNPQAQSMGSFDFNAFINESKETLLNPKAYFASMKGTGGLLEPLIKASIYGAAAGVFAFIFSILGLSLGSFGLVGNAMGVMALVLLIIDAIIGLFIGAIFILIISIICKGSNDFELNVRISASLLVLLPIMILLGFISGLNFYLGLFVNLAIGLYGLWLLYFALVEALKADLKPSRIAVLIMAGFFSILIIAAAVKTRSMTKKIMDGFDDYKEMMKDMEKEKENN